MASSSDGSSSPCRRVARGVVRPACLNCRIYSINFGSYIMRFMNIVQRARALHTWWIYTYCFVFKCIIFWNSSDFLTVWTPAILAILVFIQIHVMESLSAATMRAKPCHWAISYHAWGCAKSFCVVFSFSVGSRGILCVRVAGRKLVQIELS